MGQFFLGFIVGDNIRGEVLPVIAAPRTVVGLQPLLFNFFVIRLRGRVTLVVCLQGGTMREIGYRCGI